MYTRAVAGLQSGTQRDYGVISNGTLHSILKDHVKTHIHEVHVCILQTCNTVETSAKLDLMSLQKSMLLIVQSGTVSDYTVFLDN